MSSNNDWASLKEVIVGTAKTYNVPELNTSFLKSQFPEYDKEDIPVGCYPSWVIEEAEEDLEFTELDINYLDVNYLEDLLNVLDALAIDEDEDVLAQATSTQIAGTLLGKDPDTQILSLIHI